MVQGAVSPIFSAPLNSENIDYGNFKIMIQFINNEYFINRVAFVIFCCRWITNLKNWGIF